jgi:hypothetical protein
MAPNELIAAIQGLSSTDYIDKAMAAIGLESKRLDAKFDARMRSWRRRERRDRKTGSSVNPLGGDSTTSDED